MEPQPLPCRPACNYEFHAPAFHPINTPHSQHLRLDPHLESCRKSVVGRFCGRSQRVKAVGCFRRRAQSLMFDGIVRETLSEEVSTNAVTQVNLKLAPPPNSFDSHQTQNKMKS